jgi:NodT family efflux transporter outer membrane factor (OMF) lipoprotein
MLTYLEIAIDCRRHFRSEASFQQRSKNRSATNFAIALFACIGLLSGCTSPREYLSNCFKVGPDYCRPAADFSEQWIDSEDHRLKSGSVELAKWWQTFQDPVLNDLVQTAYGQNLSLREAAFRVLEARAELGIANGLFFPQQQFASGSFTRTQLSKFVANDILLPKKNFSTWQDGLGVGWELDFWGKYRRLIESADAHLDASVEDYDAVLVTLVGDIGQTYVQMRIAEQQAVYVAANTKLQQDSLDIAVARSSGGLTTDLDVEQAVSTLAQTESQTPQLEIQQRQFRNHLCVLLGMSAKDLSQRLGRASIPTAPPEVVIGIPAELLSRRPDVRREERKTASISARIGYAESDLYPAISITGNLGYSAQTFSDVFTTKAFTGNVGPGFQWNLLNYGRIVSNISRVESRFEAQAVKYQQTVLVAGEEAENAIVQFLLSQQQAKKLVVSVTAADKAVAIAVVQYKGGLVDFNRLSLIQQNLVQQQNLLAQAQGNIALGLVQLYRALGGGWEMRLEQVPESLTPPTAEILKTTEQPLPVGDVVKE